jgi:hypothetical protein
MDWRELNIIQYTGATSKERVEARKLLDAERIRCYNHDREHSTEFLRQFTEYYMEGFTMSAEIDDGVPIPTDTPAPAPAATGRRRGRPPGSAAKPAENAGLLAAVQFVECVENETIEFSHFAKLSNGMVLAYSNVLSAGFPIAEQLNRCPRIDMLKAALLRCGKSLAITETNDGHLSIKGDKLKAIVPCMAEPLADITPDAPVINGDFNILKEAFKAACTVADEIADRVMYASVLLDPNTVTATNGKVLLQYWHGITGLPPATVIPALFAKQIVGSKYKITGIGGNYDTNAGFMRSLTIWFENGAWLKTQCYEDRWQAFEQLLNVATNPQPVPVGLFEGIEAVEPFCKDSGAIHFGDGYVSSYLNSDAGASYPVKGLPPGKIFHAKLVRQVSPYVKTLDLLTQNDRAFFFGGTDINPIRGVFMAMSGSQ